MTNIFDTLKTIPDALRIFCVCFCGSIFFGCGFGFGTIISEEILNKDVEWEDSAAGVLGTVCGALIHFLIIYKIWQVFK